MTDVMNNIFLVAGGLGLFLFGMKLMSEALEKIAGDRMRKFLEKATSNRFLAIVMGTIVTFITNSSSATTIMVVGFVNSGLLTLFQALGVIMGANIGTTLTAQMIAFDIDAFAPLAIFIGIILYMFFRAKNVKTVGHIILGFGILFFGISVMGAPLKEFAQQPGFQSILTTFENPFLALMAGLVFTSVIQSSSATTGLLVAMYVGGVPLPFETAAFIILGSNIGTCSDSVIASIPANRESKRAAVGNIIFKITGSLVFGSLILLFPGMLEYIQKTWPDGARQVAMFHSLFNIATALLFIPFLKQYVKFLQKLIPLKPEEIKNVYEKKLLYLNDNSLTSPTLAVANAHLEVCRMGRMASDNLSLALTAFYSNDMKEAKKVLETEQIIDYLNHEISSRLVTIRALNLSNRDVDTISKMARTISDIERIGDHAENIAEYVNFDEETSTKLSPSAIAELKKLSDNTMQIIEIAMNIYNQQDISQLSEIDKLEAKIDSISKKSIKNHVDRLMREECNPRNGVIFTDMIIDLERCADHATNMAYSIVDDTIWLPKQKRLQVSGNDIPKKKSIKPNKKRKQGVL